jgi:hypothetical protein
LRRLLLRRRTGSAINRGLAAMSRLADPTATEPRANATSVVEDGYAESRSNESADASRGVKRF